MNRRRIVFALAATATFVVGIGTTVHADPQPNAIIGTVGNDLLLGTRHNDWILGRRGDDILIGRRGNDILQGGLGSDRLHAGSPMGHSGRDIVDGGPGAGFDQCFGEATDIFRRCEEITIRPWRS